jgi:HK97 gp10 family phage protein
MPEEFLKRLSRLGNKTDSILPKVLAAGAEVVERKVRSNLHEVIGNQTKTESRSTGELLESLGTTPARIDLEGNYNVKIGFSEPRKDGSSNAKIANILEYGRSNQTAKPFLKLAKTSSKQECLAAMQQQFSKELEQI